MVSTVWSGSKKAVSSQWVLACAIGLLGGCGGSDDSSLPQSTRSGQTDAAGRKTAAVLVVTDMLAQRRMTGCVENVSSDFINTKAKELTRLLPADCKIVLDNPVSLSWPEQTDRSLTQPWTLRIFNNTGSLVRTLSLSSPRTTLDAALALDRYKWSASYVTTSGATRTSGLRQFEVTSPGLTPMPNAAQILALLRARTAPRVLPPGTSFDELKNLLPNSEYAVPYARLLPIVQYYINTPLPPSPESRPASSFANDAERAAWLATLFAQTNDEVFYIEQLSFAWRFTQDPAILTAAKQRLMNLVAWDPNGGSSESNQPQANRNVYIAMAMAYDLIGSQLSSAERALLIDAFTKRITAATNALIALDQLPYNNFSNTGIQFVNRALLLVAGTPGFEAVDGFLEKSWPLFLAQFQAYGREDGGYDGSVAYAWYDLYVASRSLATVALTTGIDIGRRAYPRYMGDFLVGMTSPNKSLLSAFGDGLDQKNLYANYSGDSYRLYAGVTRQPVHDWYWRQNPDNLANTSYISPLHYMLWGRKLPAVTPLPPDKNDFVFDDVGFVAMHDNAGLANRSSVMFRASQFGSYSHAHADQNSFTLVSGGANLLISSGYYPYYNSPHHAMSRSTRYHNAVTYDGGLGQAEPVVAPTVPGAPLRTSMGAYGRLIGAQMAGPISVVTGDASMAYRNFNSATTSWVPALTGAYRSVAYFKNEHIVAIYDWLSSAVPRKWEWNYHGVDPFTTWGTGTLVAHNGTVQGCIDHYGINGSLSLSNTFDIAPENGAPQQGHARFAATQASTKAVVVTVIKENCSATPVNVTFSGDNALIWTVDHAVTMTREQATLLR